MNDTIYLTPNDYAKAESNNIPAQLLNYRVRVTSWEKEKAISTPLRQKNANAKWIKIAEENWHQLCYLSFEDTRIGMVTRKSIYRSHIG